MVIAARAKETAAIRSLRSERWGAEVDSVAKLGMFGDHPKWP
jgi:hypothetical protein